MGAPILTDADIAKLEAQGQAQDVSPSQAPILTDADMAKFDAQNSKSQADTRTTPNPKSPTYLSDMGWDALARFSKGAYDATNFLPGLKNPLADQMYNLPKASNLGQFIPEALGNAAPTIAMSAPYIAAAKAAGLGPWMANAAGFGAFSGSKAAAQGQSLLDSLKSTASGAGQGLLASVMGSGGQNVVSGTGSLLAKYFPSLAQNTSKLISPVAVKAVGTALGQGAGGAATTALMGGSPQDIINNAVVQGGLGAAFPSKVVDQDTYNDQIAKNGETYRTLIKPTASVIKKVEGGFSNKDINDSYNLMAKEGVPIIDNNGTFDTRPGQEQLAKSIQPVIQAKQQMLATNNAPQFNLKDIEKEAIDALNKKTSLDPLSRQSAEEDIRTHINSAIADPRSGGLMLNGQQLDHLKSQLYGVGYSDQAPTSEVAAKQIASVIKNKVEASYPNQPLEQVNDKIGQYAAAQNLLAQAHGKTIAATKNNIPMAIAGATAGAGVGLLNNVLGHGNPAVDSFISPITGGVATGINEFIQRAQHDPERVTKLLKSRLEGLTVR